MLNFKSPGSPEPKDAGKFALKPALYEPPQPQASTPSRAPTAPPAAQRPEPAAAPAAPAAPAATATAQAPAPAAAPARVSEPGSTLSVGINIKLKGVEISDCDRLVIEGHVEATVHSLEMEIERPGVLTGTALIDVAEVHGQFTGELTARTRLIVHGSGRVSGTIRYGSLVVEEGGVLSGDVQQIERTAAGNTSASAAAPARPAGTPEAISRRA